MYHQSGQVEAFASLIQQALADEDKRTNPHLFSKDEDRIKCFNALSFYFHQLGSAETSGEAFQKWTEESIRNLNKSDGIQLNSMESCATKTYYLISKGELMQAQNYLDSIKTVLPMHPLVNWLQALIEFGKGQYGECLKRLKMVIEYHPKCPHAVRFGIGVCYYKLGNIKKARFAFENVLKFDPTHSLANAALAILEL